MRFTSDEGGRLNKASSSKSLKLSLDIAGKPLISRPAGIDAAIFDFKVEYLTFLINYLYCFVTLLVFASKYLTFINRVCQY